MKVSELVRLLKTLPGDLTVPNSITVEGLADRARFYDLMTNQPAPQVVDLRHLTAAVN